MSASNIPILISEDPTPRRRPLRLRLADHVGTNRLDGGWWPQSRDLVVELVDLVDQLPARFGQIVGALVSPHDWDPAPRRIPVAGGVVEVDTFPRDAHMIRLNTSGRTVLRLLVIPPHFTEAQGTEALLAAATSGNAHPATDLLETVTEYPDVDPVDHWSDDGGSWWEPHPVAPSFRTSS